MQLFLTSNIWWIKKENWQKVSTEFSNENNFLDNLKNSLDNHHKFVLISSDPANYLWNDKFLDLDVKALMMSWLTFEKYEVLDYRNVDVVEEVLYESSLIFLSGWNTFVQNKFFNEINLKSYLELLSSSSIVWISAGSMNCASTVLNFPEREENIEEPIVLNWLWLCSINIDPHFDEKIRDDFQIKYVLEKSYDSLIYGIPDWSYVWDKDIYWKYYKVQNGEIYLINTDKNPI